MPVKHSLYPWSMPSTNKHKARGQKAKAYRKRSQAKEIAKKSRRVNRK